MIKNKVKKLIGENRYKKLSILKYQFYNFLCCVFPMRDEIIFESHPDFSALLIFEGTTTDRPRKFGEKYRFHSEKP